MFSVFTSIAAQQRFLESHIIITSKANEICIIYQKKFILPLNKQFHFFDDIL